jgi:hypothetical protein
VKAEFAYTCTADANLDLRNENGRPLRYHNNDVLLRYHGSSLTSMHEKEIVTTRGHDDIYM